MSTKKETIETADKLYQTIQATLEKHVPPSTETVHYRLSTVTRPRGDSWSLADEAARYLEETRETAPSCYWCGDYVEQRVLSHELKAWEVEHGTGGWIEFTDGSEIGVPSHGDVEDD